MKATAEQKALVDQQIRALRGETVYVETVEDLALRLEHAEKRAACSSRRAAVWRDKCWRLKAFLVEAGLTEEEVEAI